MSNKKTKVVETDQLKRLREILNNANDLRKKIEDQERIDEELERKVKREEKIKNGK